MTHLTYPERLLLQRLHDAEADEAEHKQAHALLDASEQARHYLEGLVEVHSAARAAEDEAWHKAPARTPLAMAEAAAEAGLTQAWTLAELAPMLERAHDGEADEAELRWLEQLLVEREDVADYMASLDETRHSVVASHQEALREISFDGFWQSVSGRLDELARPAADLDAAPKADVVEASPRAKVVSFPRQPSTTERPAFDVKEHQLMLARYFDGESSAQERAQVQAWLEIDPIAAQTLGALEELAVALHGAVDELQERADLSQIWGGVERALDAAPAQVTSLEQARQARDARRAWDRIPMRRELFAAAAAALMTLAGIGMFADKIFSARTIERTVVIVDSVEYSSGASGMVVQPATLQAQDTAQTRRDAQGAAQEDEAPTIIWLLDDEEAKSQPAANTPAAPPEPRPSSTGKSI